jgi:hypothetical protein
MTIYVCMPQSRAMMQFINWFGVSEQYVGITGIETVFDHYLGADEAVWS